jgi:hypothetical protein
MKNFLRILCFTILITSFGHLHSNTTKIAQVSQLCIACSKLPTMACADYFYSKGNQKETLVCQALYAALDISETMLKLARRPEQTSIAKVAFAIYHLLYFVEKVIDLIYFKEKQSLYKQQTIIYDYLKYGGLLSDLSASLIGETSNSSFFSRLNVFSKIWAMGIGNRKNKTYPKIFSLIALLAFLIDAGVQTGCLEIDVDQICNNLFVEHRIPNHRTNGILNKEKLDFLLGK